MKGAKYRIRPYFVNEDLGWWFQAEVSVRLFDCHLFWRRLEYWRTKELAIAAIEEHADKTTKNADESALYFDASGMQITNCP